MLLDSWLDTVSPVLRPSRAHLERCLREAEAHAVSQRAAAERRAEAMAECARRIEAARSLVFEANDGVVSWRMTELEREWRRLARRDPDDGMMELWARLAPATWTDRKLWRGGAPDARLAFAVALAADPDGVTAAESAAGRLREGLSAWGVTIGGPVRWRALEGDVPEAGTLVERLLASPREAFLAMLEATDAKDVVRARAEQLRHAVTARATDLGTPAASFAEGVAHAAFVDFLWHAAVDLHVLSSPTRESPVLPLCDLWRTGYVLGGADEGGITLLAPVDGIAVAAS